MTQQKIISSYLRQVKRNCPFAFRRKLLTDLKSHLLDYFDDNPDSTLEDITHNLGPPEKYADEYLLSMDEPARKKFIQKDRWIKWSCLVGVVSIVLIVTVTATWMLVDISQKRIHYCYEYVTENNIKQN